MAMLDYQMVIYYDIVSSVSLYFKIFQMIATRPRSIYEYATMIYDVNMMWGCKKEI